jgi:hypothetical protein
MIISPRKLVLLAAAGLCLAGCATARHDAADADRCREQGLAPSTPTFDDCVASAEADHQDQQRRRMNRLQDTQNAQMDSFMHSGATSF